MVSEIYGKIIDIDLCREVNIPLAPSIESLEVSDYRLLTLFLQKERFWKQRNEERAAKGKK